MQWEVYDERRRQTVPHGARKMDCSEVNNNSGASAPQSPARPGHYHRGLSGEPPLPPRREWRPALTILHDCVRMCARMYGKAVSKDGKGLAEDKFCLHLGSKVGMTKMCVRVMMGWWVRM